MQQTTPNTNASCKLDDGNASKKPGFFSRLFNRAKTDQSKKTIVIPPGGLDPNVDHVITIPSHLQEAPVVYALDATHPIHPRSRLFQYHANVNQDTSPGSCNQCSQTERPKRRVISAEQGSDAPIASEESSSAEDSKEKLRLKRRRKRRRKMIKRRREVCPCPIESQLRYPAADFASRINPIFKPSYAQSQGMPLDIQTAQLAASYKDHMSFGYDFPGTSLYSGSPQALIGMNHQYQSSTSRYQHYADLELPLYRDEKDQNGPVNGNKQSTSACQSSCCSKQGSQIDKDRIMSTTMMPTSITYYKDNEGNYIITGIGNTPRKSMGKDHVRFQNTDSM